MKSKRDKDGKRNVSYLLFDNGSLEIRTKNYEKPLYAYSP